MMDKNKNKDEGKTTNEKPVSLHPLTFVDALKALLDTTPEDLEKAEKKEKEKADEK